MDNEQNVIPPMPENKGYAQEFSDFMDDFRLKEISGEEVGLMVAKMANHFARYNLMLVRANKLNSHAARDIYSQVDSNGKEISASKAKIIAEATDEANMFEEAKAHVQNLEQIINSLKSLQKGVLLEYSHPA